MAAKLNFLGPAPARSGSRRRTRSPGQAPAFRRLQLERLENRELLSLSSPVLPLPAGAGGNEMPARDLAVAAPIASPTQATIAEVPAAGALDASAALPDLSGWWRGPLTEKNPLSPTPTTFTMTLRISATPRWTNIFTGTMWDNHGNSRSFWGTLSKTGRIVIDVSTEGQFMMFQLVGQLDSKNRMSGKVGIWDTHGGKTEGDFRFGRVGQSLDLVATSLAWNAKQGGADLGYRVEGKPLPQDTTAELYWATGPTRKDIIACALKNPVPIRKSSPVERTMTVHVAPSKFARKPPAKATHLLLVLDPDHRIAEYSAAVRAGNHIAQANAAVDDNNVKAVRTPLRIKESDKAKYAISADATMPKIAVQPIITIKDRDEVARIIVSWTVDIEYDPSTAPHGHRSMEPPITDTFTGDITYGVSTYLPRFRNKVRGGYVTFKAQATIAGITYTAKSERLEIDGTNPSLGAIEEYVKVKMAEKGLPQYVDIVGKILKKESGYEQFNAKPNGGQSIHPYWSQDGLGGVGLGQITKPKPTKDEVWNWKANVDAVVNKFKNAYYAAKAYPNGKSAYDLHQAKDFEATAAATLLWVNGQRKAKGLPALVELQVPEFKVDAVFAKDELLKDMIRGYNGYGGKPFLRGANLHEYRLRMTNGRFDVTAGPTSTIGTLQWEEIPPSERQQTKGLPAYVGIILRQKEWTTEKP